MAQKPTKAKDKTSSKGAGKAGASAQKSNKKSGRNQKKAGGTGRLLVYAVLATMLFVAPPIAALAILGLMPTFVILFVDIAPEKSTRLSAMFAFNLAGVLPYMVQMWEQGPSFANLMRIVGDVMAWTVMLGAAGAGAAVLWVCPVLAAGIQQYLNSDRAYKLEKQRDALIKEWGEGVSSARRAPKEPKPAASAQ
ncbi:hypothetical protein JCM17844_07540 [Iodidimonas gelatinilytica]|uniref:Uncharacterized protein n=1 Tax=Iodidimonas gelatinilytica TaxID=1236966 RepID=A0A5A7MMF0_9PROT|nr:hypothetical protein [Iodidimonas gelatinilytica]GEQ97117.1 hypothetical protein JCM17844_07540 [Iodidimonas gelatinilytica]